MKRLKTVSKILAITLLLFLFAGSTLALDVTPDHLITNSQNWQDVYSGMLFGNLYGIESNFLVSTNHATLLLYSISTTEDNILVVSSRSMPYIVGYDDILKSKGYAAPVEIRSSNINLRLAEELAEDKPEINSYIVIDDAYGYNAISVGPFASAAKYYVLFANSNNIDDIESFLSDRNPDNLILYGQLDREVKQALDVFDPEVINKGNRFDNNIEIVKKYQEIAHSKQVILTNGEFIEASLLSGKDPVLFLGKENVPEQIRDYIQNSDIEVGILIGNELVGSATFVRRQLGISVFVKFAQGARQPTGAIAKVEDLDRFPMPSYDLVLDVTNIVYNKGTGALEVTFKNERDLALFFKSTITLRDGGEVKITGDNTPVFLDGNEYKTVLYLYDVDGTPLNLNGEDLSGDIFAVYGEGPQSLEKTLQKSFKIDVIEVFDDSQINITDLYYDKVKGQFFIQVKNVGDVDTYVNLELIDLVINDEELTVGADEIIKLSAGKKAWIPVTIDMAEEDFTKNPTIRVRGYYGERELALVKMTETEFELRFGGGYGNYIVYTLITVLILILFFFLGTKKKCKHCGYKNPRGRKTCMKCHHKF